MRAIVALLALTEAVLGGWTLLFPRSFYDTVPTVALDPPFSDHLFRDFGAASLGIAVVLTAAAVTLERTLVRVALMAYLTFAVPHLVFHVTRTGHYGQAEGTLVLAGLATAVVLGAIALSMTRRLPKVVS
ncbi:hypothetical protein SAMN05192558_10371 [Actinokineospora alba]|uniref:DoxX-like family protein n=1 Tax=Actinokineospora alba TaxID=504798 RepID=A0A1H0JFI3_9PSEU|nr:hypothetical protein [Actinokineospora alba]TDP68306.1 hypothetical protein C8E96_3871 [Actinokineospora alba]SDH96521.1 hypothetical protein SAMN05421871_102978 [Actinokineospora alba]SDO42555.1 hypothetical protein SAMN05192558_10371 [Actinokineospora alba]